MRNVGILVVLAVSMTTVLQGAQVTRPGGAHAAGTQSQGADDGKKIEKTGPCAAPGTQEPQQPTSATTETSRGAAWDPVVVWDGPQRGEQAAFFVLGAIFSALISTLVMRIRRKRELPSTTQRILN